MTDFTFYTPENSQGEAKEILTKVENKYGFIPRLFNYMAEAPYIIDAYAYMTGLLDKTDFSDAQKQVALLAVSQYHDCHFCTTAHRAFGKMHQANPQTISAIMTNETIEDAKDKALVDMINISLDKRGWVEDKDLEAFYAAGFSQRNVYDVILVISIKTLSNYSNHLTKPEPNPELISML